MARAAESGGEFVTGQARRISSPPAGARTRLARIERLAWVLDRSIPIGRWRIGLDPLLGLLPGIGDTVGAGLSFYVVYEAARLGAPGGVLLRMAGNILVESVLGAVPLLGDLFDFVWQANARNVALLHRHYSGDWQPRPLGRVLITVGFVALAFIVGLIALAWWVFSALVRLTPFGG